MTTYNNSINEGTRTAHGIMLAQGAGATPNYLVLGAGKVAIGTTSSDPSGATLTQGSNITITSASGSITIAGSAGSSGLTWIASATASTSSVINFSNDLTSTYDNYLLVFENVVVSDFSYYMELQIGTGATPTYQTSNYSGAQIGIDSSTVTPYGIDWTAGSVNVTGATAIENPASPATFSGTVNIFNANNASNHKSFYTVACGDFYDVVLTGTAQGFINGGGSWTAATVLTSCRIKMASGTITSGVFKLYGYQN